MTDEEKKEKEIRDKKLDIAWRALIDISEDRSWYWSVDHNPRQIALEAIKRVLGVE